MVDCFLVGNSVDLDQTLHYAASGWGLLTVFIGSFSRDKSISAGNGVIPSRRGIVRCLIGVCIPLHGCFFAPLNYFLPTAVDLSL